MSALKDTFDRAAPAPDRSGARVPCRASRQPVVSLWAQRHCLRRGHRRGLLSPRLRAPALAIAAAVALSRVYLRVHFPLDVVAGALVGALLGALCALAALRLARAAAPAQAA